MRLTNCALARFFLYVSRLAGLSALVLRASAARALASAGLLPVGKSRMCPTLDLTMYSSPR